MNEKLFEIRQVLLFIGFYPSEYETEINQLIKGLGFSVKVNIYGHNAMETKNLYSGYFEGGAEGEVLEIVKENIYEKCKSLNIPVLDFFLIDSTDSPMFKSIWHDEFY
jgi:hypothetical protein